MTVVSIEHPNRRAAVSERILRSLLEWFGIETASVLPDHHRRGIGAALVEAAQSSLRDEGVEYLQVKTLGPSRPDERYDRTRRFYERCGFAPLEEIHGLWEGNACLVMVKHL